MEKITNKLLINTIENLNINNAWLSNKYIEYAQTEQTKKDFAEATNNDQLIIKSINRYLNINNKKMYDMQQLIDKLTELSTSEQINILIEKLEWTIQTMSE